MVGLVCTERLDLVDCHLLGDDRSAVGIGVVRYPARLILKIDDYCNGVHQFLVR